MSTAERWRRAALVLVALLGLLVVAVAGVLTSRAAPTAPIPTGEQPAQGSLGSPGRHTLLVQVRDDALVATNVLLGDAHPEGEATLTDIPAGLVVAQPEGPVRFDQTVPGIDEPQTSAEALQSLLGARVDAAFVLERLAFEALVDGVGGVWVDVTDEVPGPPAPAVAGGSAEPTPSGSAGENSDGVPIPLGWQLLDGPHAAAYALTEVAGEAPSARPARVDQVLRQVIVRLPAEPEQVRALLASLGSLSRSTVPPEQLAQFFGRLRLDLGVGRFVRPELPTVAVPGTVSDRRIDPQPAREFVARYLPGLELEPGPEVPVRVLVRWHPGSAPTPEELDALVVDLGAGGLVAIDGGPLDVGDDASTDAATRVIVASTPSVALTWAVQVVDALGLSTSQVVVSPAGPVFGDVGLVVGSDPLPVRG